MTAILSETETLHISASVEINEHLTAVDTLIGLGQIQKATFQAQQGAQLYSNNVVALLKYIECLRLSGRALEAGNILSHAIQIAPDNAHVLFELGLLHERKNEIGSSINYYTKAIEHADCPKQAYLQLAALYSRSDNKAGALNVLIAAEKAFPEDPDIIYMRGRMAAGYTSAWHLPMLADDARNHAYQQAIQQTIRTGDIVLDIGTGSGLLAMMSVEAGAEHVYACESNPILADLANKVIAQNGMDHAITIISKHSSQMAVGIDMPVHADVLVTEIFDNALVGEGVLPSINHAWSHLLKSDARIIPHGATLKAVLASAPTMNRFHTVTRVSQFDLSAMSALAHPMSYKDIEPSFFNDGANQVLSDPFIVKSFDFTSSPALNFQEYSDALVTKDGVADSIVLWFDLHLTSDIVFSTERIEPHQHWRQVCQVLLQTTNVQNNTKYQVLTQYNRYYHFQLNPIAPEEQY